MKINKTVNGTELVIALNGRLDTNTAPMLDTELSSSLPGMTSLIIDMKELEYISSAGLRVLLSAHKTMSKQGKMVVKNCSDDVMDIFDVTGFTDILTIEK